ncbi:unnamed protein product [Cunninghamella blakesleeana]
MTSIQQTLGFIKPNVINKKEELLTLIKANHSQWKITFEQELILSVGEAKSLYPKEAEALWLSSRPIYVFILEGNNVINNWLEFVGPMNPLKAKQYSPQSLRALYGVNSLHNVCHASDSEEKAYQDLIWLQGLVLEDLKIKKPIVSTKSKSPSTSMENNNSGTKKELKKPTKLKKPSNVPSKISKPNTTTTSSSSSLPANDNTLPTSKTSSTSSISSTNSNPSALKKKSNIVPPKSSTNNNTNTNNKVNHTSPSSSALKNTKQQKPNLIPPSTTPSKVSQSKYDRMKPRTSRIASSSGMKEKTLSNGKKLSDNKPNGNTSSLPVGTSNNNNNSNNNKRISSTGGISKNIPAKSVLTGRPRKYSRAKKEDIPSNLVSSTPIKEEDTSSLPLKENQLDIVSLMKENENENKLEEKDEKNEMISSSSTSPVSKTVLDHHDQQQEEQKDEKEDEKENQLVHNDEEEEEEKDKVVEGSISSSSTAATTEPIEPLPSITSTTVCSQATTESDHDAEVAATTSKFVDNINNNTITTTTTTTTTATNHVKSMAANIITTGLNTVKSNPVESPTAMAIRRLSNTSSAASTLPRPETPEVDNIRQKFESMSQLNNNNNNTTPIMTTKRNSINPEVASRIKDMKPRDPVGNRVKSMVEFFMDENLHKWEF